MAEERANKVAQLDTRRVLPVFLLVFVDVLGLTVILPLLHLYAAGLWRDPAANRRHAGGLSLAQLVGVPVMGALSDRYGRKPLLLISQATTCVSFVMLGLATSLEMVILSRLIDGLFGANLATAQAALSDITDEGSRTRGLGIIGAAFGLGFIFGPVISLVALELSNSLAVPAFTAAIYSFVSVLVTTFMFRETHPPSARRRGRRAGGAGADGALSAAAGVGRAADDDVRAAAHILWIREPAGFIHADAAGLSGARQCGALSRDRPHFSPGATALHRPLEREIRRQGLATLALALLALGLLLTGLTPDAPHPFYVRELAQRDMLAAAPSQTEAIIGELGLELPPNGKNSLAGVLWLLVALIPVSIGAGLIRPALNSLLTQRVGPGDYGGILGVSAALVSAANAAAPMLAGLIFQSYGGSAPFLAAAC